jgi:tRNA-dihydrouridine synthase
MGNPWIFEQALALGRRQPVRPPTPEQRFATIERHVALMEQSFEDRGALAANLKKYLAAYSRGLPRSAAFRQATLEAGELDAVLALARDFFAVPRGEDSCRAI